MSRVRVKICGLTRSEDLRHCLELGADAVGLVFAPDSPRSLDVERAQALAAQASGLCWRIGLFRNARADTVGRTIEQVSLDMLQFHGDEDDAFCNGFSLPWIKAVSVSETAEPGWQKRWPRARAFIVDSHSPGAGGGTGRTFDWARFPGDSERPSLLAGGLRPENVGRAIAEARPYGVDVSSGVESSPGIKDQQRLQDFFKEVRKAHEQ